MNDYKLESKRQDVSEIAITAIFIAFINFLTLFGKNQDLNNVYVIVSIFPLFLYYSHTKFSVFKSIKTNNYIVLWYAFSISILLAELQNGNIGDSIFLLIFPVILLASNIKLKNILLAIIIGVFPFTVLALVSIMFGNVFTSNSIGIITSTLIVSSGCLYLMNKNDKYRAIKYGAIVIYALFLLIEINSRSSLLIAIVTIILFSIIIVSKNKKTSFKNTIFKGNRKLSTLVLLVSLVVLVVSLTFLFSLVLTPKWGANDLTTGRLYIWLTSIKYGATLFGNSYNWYDISSVFGVYRGPHNVFIGILSFGGLISLILFLLFLYNFIKEIFRKIHQSYGSNIYCLLIFAAASLVKGLTESLLLQSYYGIYNIIFIVSFVYLFNDDLKSKDTSLMIESKKSSIKLVASILWMFAILIYVSFGSAFDFNLNEILETLNKYLFIFPSLL